jgi:hypothetical protein
MARQNIALLTLTVAATAALTANRFIGHDGDFASAAGSALGVSRSDAAIGEDLPVDVLGTAVVEAGALIAAGAAVEVGTDGKAVTESAGIAVGRLAPGAAAGAAGEFVEVILIPN